MRNVENDFALAGRIIRDHYRLDRIPTLAEIAGEIANCRRKMESGNLCDLARPLALELRKYGFLD